MSQTYFLFVIIHHTSGLLSSIDAQQTDTQMFPDTEHICDICPVTDTVTVLCILMSSYESLSLNTLHVFSMIAGACV